MPAPTVGRPRSRTSGAPAHPGPACPVVPRASRAVGATRTADGARSEGEHGGPAAGLPVGTAIGPVDRPRAAGRAPGSRTRRLAGTWAGLRGLEELRETLPTLAADPAAFSVSLRSMSLGAFAITLARHSALRWTGSGDNFGYRVPTLRLLVVMRGRVTLRNGARTDVVLPRGGALLVGWKPLDYTTHGDTVVVTCDVAADEPGLRPVADRVGPATWQAESGILGALAAFLEDVLDDRTSRGPAGRAQLCQAIESLVLAVVLAAPTPADGDWARRVQRARVAEHVAVHCLDPELTPETVAARFGMSVRSLHRIFEGTGTSVGKMIADQRAERALALLSDPRYASMPLDEVARRTGHGTALSMRRAVTAATGRCPSEIRAETVAA